MSNNLPQLPDPGRPQKIGNWGDVILILGLAGIVIWLVFW